MPYYRTKIISGDVLEIEESFSPRRRGENISRDKRKGLTTDQQQALNFSNAKKKLMRLINTNFGREDLFITLTHGILVSIEEAVKIRNSYLRKVRGIRKKKGLPEMKYIAVTESDGKRVHHHIIMSGMPLEDAIKEWKHGRVILSNLDIEGDYIGLANYIMKEKKKPGEKRQKRWSQSRNLDKPEIQVKEIKRISKTAKEPKGYKIIQHDYKVSMLFGERNYIKCLRIGGLDLSGKQILKE